MQFFKVTNHPPASRPLHWLFPLPGTYFSWLIMWLTPSLLSRFYPNVFLSGRILPWLPCNLSFLTIISELYFSLALSTAQHLNVYLFPVFVFLIPHFPHPHISSIKVCLIHYKTVSGIVLASRRCSVNISWMNEWMNERQPFGKIRYEKRSNKMNFRTTTDCPDIKRRPFESQSWQYPSNANFEGLSAPLLTRRSLLHLSDNTL